MYGMKKTEKKPAAKEVHKEHPPEAEVVIEPTAVEDKPKVMFEPVIEEATSPASVLLSEASTAVTAPTVVVAATTESQAVVSPVLPPDMPSAEEPVKPEVPAGALARSIDTLAKIVDDSKTGTEQIAQTAEKSSKRNGNSGALGMILAFIIGLCLGIVAGYVLWGRFVIGGVVVSTENEEVISEERAVISPVITPIPAITELKRSDLKIKVLNGTGGKGVAAAGKTYLEGLGYVGVEAGNAKRNDYAKTEVILSKDKAKFWEMLKKDLTTKYNLVDGFTTDAELLEASGGVDALVIVGAE